MTTPPPSRLRLFWTRVRNALPAILLAIVGTYILSRLGTLHGLERLVADAEMAATPQPSAEIRLVNITNDDYDNHFRGQPASVNPDKLYELIDAIALSHPAVIAVDIDTHNPSFKKFRPNPNWKNVIWERELASDVYKRQFVHD